MTCEHGCLAAPQPPVSQRPTHYRSMSASGKHATLLSVARSTLTRAKVVGCRYHGACGAASAPDPLVRTGMTQHTQFRPWDTVVSSTHFLCHPCQSQLLMRAARPQGVPHGPLWQPAPTPLVGHLGAVCLFCLKVGVKCTRGMPG
jgi:hypothetical protein